MVGTMNTVSTRCFSISASISSASKRGIITSTPPSRPERTPKEFGAEW
jgi:hypothetical protein